MITRANRRVASIMKNFDFERVHRCMTSLGWEWVGPPKAVPTIDQLRETAEELLKEVAETSSVDDVRCVQTGGFEAWSLHNALVLKFVVTKREAFPPHNPLTNMQYSPGG